MYNISNSHNYDLLKNLNYNTINYNNNSKNDIKLKK